MKSNATNKPVPTQEKPAEKVEVAENGETVETTKPKKRTRTKKA